METFLLVLSLLATVIIAVLIGKLFGKIKLPAILGFLITGMILGPYALNLLSNELTESTWYHMICQISELLVGFLLAKELVIKKMRSYGKQVTTITIFESMGTFALVTLVFSIIFLITGVPLYVALIFGGIALATAPAPSLSIVNEYKTKGEITKTLIPVAVLDDVIAIVVFFVINAFIASMGSDVSSNVFVTLILSIGVPILLGIVLGFVASLVYNKTSNKKLYRPVTIVIVILSFICAYLINNYLLPEPTMNFLLIGMALFTVVTNKVTEEKMEDICASVMSMVSISLVVMILNLSSPLDYKLIFGAGILTFVYIVIRGFGKYFGTFFGAKVSCSSNNVRKYLGLTLLPHSGVSLIFTGMAVVSLSTFDNESALLVQGTIAAAAVINEIIAVVLAKKGFEFAGEINDDTNEEINTEVNETDSLDNSMGIEK